MTYCEAFPRDLAVSNGLNATGLQYWAQVGKPVIYMPMYDNIYQAMLSVFIILTADNWDVNMKQMMVLAGPILSALFTIITMVIGIYTVLNLFLAILLSNLDQLSGNGDNSSETISETNDDADAFRADSSTSHRDGSSLRSKSMSLMDRVTTSSTSFWLPKSMQTKLLANSLRLREEENTYLRDYKQTIIASDNPGKVGGFTLMGTQLN